MEIILIIIAVTLVISVIFFKSKIDLTDKNMNDNQIYQNKKNNQIIDSLKELKTNFDNQLNDLEKKHKVKEEKLLHSIKNDIETINSKILLLDKDFQSKIEIISNEHLTTKKELKQHIIREKTSILEILNKNIDDLKALLKNKLINQDREQKTVMENLHNNLKEQIVNVSNLIDANLLNQKLEHDKSLKYILNLSIEKINDLKIQIDYINKKIEHFTEIEDDSKRLNVEIDIEKENELIDKILGYKVDSLKETSKINHSKEILENLNRNQQKLYSDLDNNIEILDEKQQNAFDIMTKSKDNIFVSGQAGTGKSFLLKLFSKGAQKKHLIVAPTGIAALNVQGVTIHSAFGFENLLPGNDLSSLKLNSEKRLVLEKIETLIIDEISMVRADIFEKINLILQKINKNTQLFGGKQVIVFGDLFQLPPIAKPDEERYLKDTFGGKFFFHSNAYKNANFKFVELTENHRQNNDEGFFDILNDIRVGKQTNDQIDKLNERYNPTKNLRRILKLFPKKSDVEIVNKKELDAIPAKEYMFKAKILVQKYKNSTRNIEDNFPISDELKLKVGALILMTKNDINKRWVNGTLGIISKIGENHLKVTIGGYEYQVDKESFESYEAKYSNGKIEYEKILEVEQFPLILAYAITIHKSQGMTYKEVSCDLSKIFEEGQSYVALSRCSSLNGLHLMEKINGKHIKINNDVVEFYENVH